MGLYLLVFSMDVIMHKYGTENPPSFIHEIDLYRIVSSSFVAKMFRIISKVPVILLYFIIFTEYHLSVQADLVLESTPHTNWGVWGPFENCTFGHVVLAFQLKTEPDQGSDDDTALNGIRFFCGDPRYPGTFTYNITSSVGEWGYWGQTLQCGFGEGLMNGFQMNVESNLGISGDDTATDNLRIKCATHVHLDEFLEGDGLSFGLWRDVHVCPVQHALCGLQTQIEPYQGNSDDTALNNIRVKCCQI